MRTHLIFAAAATATIATPAAASECLPRFLQTSQTVSLNVTEVGSNSSARENFNIRVRNEDKGSCSATLRFSRQSISAGVTPVDYQLVSGGQTIDILPSETSVPSTRSDLYVPGLPGGANGRAVPFRLTFPAEWGLQSGMRREELLVTLLDDKGTAVDTMLLYLDFNVPPAVELRIVGVTGNDTVAEIRLGTLDPKKVSYSDPFAVRIWSTAPYAVAFESDGKGALMHRDGQGRIAYSLRMNGIAVDLNGGAPRMVSQATGPMGDLHPLQVEVQPFMAQAGDYADRVSVTVTAG